MCITIWWCASDPAGLHPYIYIYIYVHVYLLNAAACMSACMGTLNLLSRVTASTSTIIRRTTYVMRVLQCARASSMQTSKQSLHEVTSGTANHCVEDNSQVSIKHRICWLPASSDALHAWIEFEPAWFGGKMACLHCWWQATLYWPCMHAILHSEWHTAHLEFVLDELRHTEILVEHQLDTTHNSRSLTACSLGMLHISCLHSIYWILQCKTIPDAICCTPRRAYINRSSVCRTVIPVQEASSSKCKNRVG